MHGLHGHVLGDEAFVERMQAPAAPQNSVDRDFPRVQRSKGEPLADVMRELIAFVGPNRLVTFNAEFDMAFLHAATTRHGLPELNNPVSCAVEMESIANHGDRSALPRKKNA